MRVYFLRLTMVAAWAFLSAPGFGQCGDGVAANCPPSLTADDVKNIYANVIGQAPSDYDVKLYTGMSSNYTKDQMTSVIASNATSQASLSAYYKSQTGQTPDAATLKNFTQTLAASGLAATQSVINGTSAAAAYRASEVENLYQGELKRTSSGDAGAQTWADKLKTESLQQVANDIANSTEGQQDVAAAFQAVTGRAPTAADLAAFTKVLAADGQAGLTQALQIWNRNQGATASSGLLDSALGSTASSTAATPASSTCTTAYNSCILDTCNNLETNDAMNTCRANCTSAQASCVANAGSSAGSTTNTTTGSGFTFTLGNSTNTGTASTGTASNSIASALTGSSTGTSTNISTSGSTVGTASTGTATNQGAVRSQADEAAASGVNLLGSSGSFSGR